MESFLEAERAQLPPWVVVGFGAGIALWFWLDTPREWLAVMALAGRALKRFGDAPAGLVQLVQGGRDVGEALVDDPRAPGAYGGIAFDDEERTAHGSQMLPGRHEDCVEQRGRDTGRAHFTNAPRRIKRYYRYAAGSCFQQNIGKSFVIRTH